MSNLSYKNLFKISIFSKEEKRGDFVRVIYKECPVCGNSKTSFWVKIYKCLKCGADKFEWHTRVWCRTLSNKNRYN